MSILAKDVKVNFSNSHALLSSNKYKNKLHLGNHNMNVKIIKKKGKKK